MLELLSPHFIWWSSASSPPLLLIRHGSPLSLFPLPLFLLRFQLHPSLLCTLLFTHPSVSFFWLFYFFFLTPLFCRISPFQESVPSLLLLCCPPTRFSQLQSLPTPASAPKKRRRGDPQSFPSTSTMNGLLSVQHLGWIQSERVGSGGGAVRGDGGVLNF